MVGMDIPEEAVEAAEQAVIDAMIKYGPDGHVDGYEQITRAALEAAAPYMLAEAWGEGHQDGWSDRHDDAEAGWIPSGYTSDTPNPYRSQP